MAKKQFGGEASAEAAKKRRPHRKTAAPKAGAKKPQGKPARKVAKKPRAEPGHPSLASLASLTPQAELPISDVDIVEKPRSSPIRPSWRPKRPRPRAMPRSISPAAA